MAGLDAQDAQDGAVEALGGREVRDGDADVVEHPAEATVAGLPEARTHGILSSLPVGSKQPGFALNQGGVVVVPAVPAPFDENRLDSRTVEAATCSLLLA